MESWNFSNSEKFPSVYQYTYPMMIFWIASFSSWDALVSFADKPQHIYRHLQFHASLGRSITDIQKQIDITIRFPCFEEIFAMLNQMDQMCSSHSKMWYSFSVYLYICILYQIHPRYVNLSKLRLSTIIRSALSWCTNFSWFQTVPVTLVHHTVLSQLLYVTTCTVSSCQWWGWVIWAVIWIVTNFCISCHV